MLALILERCTIGFSVVVAFLAVLGLLTFYISKMYQKTFLLLYTNQRVTNFWISRPPELKYFVIDFVSILLPLGHYLLSK